MGKSSKYQEMVFTKGKDGKFKAKTITVTTKMKVACELCFPHGEEIGWIGDLLLIYHKKQFKLLQAPYHDDVVYIFPCKPYPEPKVKNKNLKPFNKWYELAEKFEPEMHLNSVYSFMTSMIKNKEWDGKESLPLVVWHRAAKLTTKWENKKP